MPISDLKKLIINYKYIFLGKEFDFMCTNNSLEIGLTVECDLNVYSMKKNATVFIDYGDGNPPETVFLELNSMTLFYLLFSFF